MEIDRSDRLKLRELFMLLGEEVYETHEVMVSKGRRFWFDIFDGVEYVKSVEEK